MLDASPTDAVCPHCEGLFLRSRPNKQYCTPQCAKAASRNAARGPRTVAASPELRLRSRRHYGRAMELAASIYSSPVGERLGMMAALIAAARDGDTELRNILTDPRLLTASPVQDRHLFFKRCPGSYRTISQAANAYCRKFWGSGVQEVVSGNASEPPTGEPEDTVGHSPRQTASSGPKKPEGWDYRATLGGTCKGLLWLPISRSKIERQNGKSKKTAA